MVKMGRRNFFRLALTVVAALFVFIWDRLISDHLEMKKKKVHILPFDSNKKVSFDDNYLVVNYQGETNVLSSHCTHLGCIIDETIGDRLVCPCHGSEYDLEGNVIRGPAYKSLERIPFKFLSDGTHIEIAG